MKRKITTLLLAIVMAIMLLPTAIFVFADESGTSEKNVTLGTSALQGAQKSNVYYGTYKQSSDGQGGFNTDPVKWRVLSNLDDKLFLLADQNLDVFQYNTARVDVTWETSTMRSWLNGYEESNNGQSIDYTSDNFINTAFSTQELTYIPKTTLENADHSTGTAGGNSTDDYVFLLSTADVNNTAYGFTATATYKNNSTRVSTNTAYVADGGKIDALYVKKTGEANSWWLRSPGKNGSTYAMYVHQDGSTNPGSYVNINSNVVRPAFNLNSAAVLFTSAAKGGKTAFSANADSASSEGYKLTMSDESRSGFSAEILKSGTKAFVSYSGATTGTNEHITAMIVNASGEVTYYGSLKNVTESADASRTIEIDLSGMKSGDKVYILNEQWNGDYKTDYASALKAATISTEKNIALGTSAIADGDQTNLKWDYVYFGTYGGKQIKWRVLSTSGNGGTYTDANGSNSDDAIFLLSEYALQVMTLDDSSNTWKDSDARTWLQETFGTTSYFTAEELLAVLKTTKTDNSETLYGKTWKTSELNSDTFFFISAREATDCLGANSQDKGLKAYYYNNAGDAWWWLRSPYDADDADVGVGVVFASGWVGYCNADYNNAAARPAFNLNSASVLFTSDAKGGKSAFAANTDLASSEGYKLTLLDASRSGFSAKILKTSTKTFVSYSGATTGENEYITAMIVNANGEVTYYGSLKNVTETADASGTIEINLYGMNSGDKLYVLNEQWNGDYSTDYASALTEVTVPTDVNEYYISFNGNSGVGTMNGILTEESEYILPECAFTYEGYVFAGWSYTAGGEVIKENSVTLTQDITLYAVWSPRSETIDKLDNAIKNLDTAMKDGNADLSAEIADLNTALTNAKNALEETDSANKSELENKIATAQTTLQRAIDKVAQDLETAKSELNAAITSGNANLTAEIADLNTALTNAKNALEEADLANKSELENKITTAQTTLQSAIDKMAQDLETAKNELENKITTAQTTLQSTIDKMAQDLETVKSELTQKDSALQTFITITCVLSCVTLCGFGGFVVWFFVDKKKRC